MDGAAPVLLGEIAADAGRADDAAVAAADQHAAGHRDDPALRRVREGRNEGGGSGGTAGQFAAAETPAEDAPGFALRDLRPQDAGAVLPLEGEEVPAGIKHGGSERLQFQSAPLLQRPGDDEPR